jgi:NADPH-dependent 2,4-dienoyl-CoA reductase/sulfur reductase-like enzyme
MARRHVLIGSGPASIAAAETIRGLDPDAEITVVGAERYGYYSRPGLAYFLAKEVSEKGLFPFAPDDFMRLGIQFVNERALHVDPAAHRVTLQSGQELPYDRLLIATGSWAIPVEVPGADLDGVTKLDDMHDAHDLVRRSRKAKAAVVVGGGITALEIVEGLSARRVDVNYLMRKDRYWGNVLSESESRIIEEGLRARGVRIHYFTELAEILGRDGRVVGVSTNDGTLIPCDLVAVAIGVLPQKDLAEAAGLVCGRGVLVDRYLRSSDDDIFAAGDIAEVHDVVTGRDTVEVLWNSAVVKGRIAGYNMATEPTRAYDPGSPLNVTRIAGFKMTIMGTVGSGKDSDLKGIARGDSETWRQLGEASVVEAQIGDAHVRLALGERVIAGAIVMGDQALSFPLQELIGARVDVSDIIADLEAPGAPIADIVERFWQDWKAHHA